MAELSVKMLKLVSDVKELNTVILTVYLRTVKDIHCGVKKCIENNPTQVMLKLRWGIEQTPTAVMSLQFISQV